jgi:hypothetical protein
MELDADLATRIHQLNLQGRTLAAVKMPAALLADDYDPSPYRR